MQDLDIAYWGCGGKTMRNDITMEQRKERYAEIWKDFKDMSQSQFIEKVPQTDIMKYDYMKEFRNRDSRLYVSMMFPFKGWHETIKGTFYFRWDPDLINRDGMNHGPDIFIVKWSLLIHTIPGLQKKTIR